jgi:uncharacterized protein (TIGR02246 family)
MKKTICSLSLLILTVASGARAQDKAAAPPGAPDMSKMGPWSKPVTKEKEDKKGVDELYKAMEAAWMKGDVDALVELVDFPVIMLSDDSAGNVQHFPASREQWTNMMKGFATTMPKNIKMTHKHTAHFLSDDLAVVIEETSIASGPMKGKWKGFSVVTNKDGKWKVKEMAEAGWGDMKPPSAASAKK